MVPSIMSIHERFLDELKKRLDSWDAMQRVGDVYIDIVNIFNYFLLKLINFYVSHFSSQSQLCWSHI